MSSAQTAQHPGPHIRQHIIPKGMSVTDAAKLLGVGRPALSNLLNGNAGLSADMAARIARAFGAEAQTLILMQNTYDALQSNARGAAAMVRSHVPPFLQAKANDIEKWADPISSRAKLAVFLRTLIHSTGCGLVQADFPGHDDAERRGWDGYLEAAEGNPWVPAGVSGWEFSTSDDFPGKPDRDFAKSIKVVSKHDRANITFVFVTPRRWHGKHKWREKCLAAGEWKDVRVFDSSDLEQWLEQSIPGQIWFAGEQYESFRGTKSLDACWREWNAQSEPPFTQHIFDEASLSAKAKILDALKNSPHLPIRMAADSREEALAFLSCILSADDQQTAPFRDRAVVFTEKGALAEVACKSVAFLPIIADREVEKEWGNLNHKTGAILIYPRNYRGADPSIVLEPLSYMAFRQALGSMGVDGDQIDRLQRESGGSLTVLRRRLSQNTAIRSPEWSANNDHARALIPFLFAGAWNAANKADQAILVFLAGATDYAQLEQNFNTLLNLEESPVWRVGSFCGVISKLDALFAILHHITDSDLNRFYQVAELVLDEPDPALDLPEEDRWAAGMYDKTREITAALRESVCENLVLLAIHGKTLLQSRISIDPQAQANRLIQNLLASDNPQNFESQAKDMPLYAEAAPDAFLSILEADLAKPASQALALMRPVHSNALLFGSSPRVGLIWALENLAWSREYVDRVVTILAKLAAVKIEDNLVNRPDISLQAIFRYWMPQTSVGLVHRKALLKRITQEYPAVGWSMCIDQIPHDYGVGHSNHKPRWRDYAFGFGEPNIPESDQIDFVHYAIKLALEEWPEHSKEELADLVMRLRGLSRAQQTQLWNLIGTWAQQASDEDRAWLREKIRIHTMTRRAVKFSGKTPRDPEPARRSYQALEPRDLILKHAWLFKEYWVEESQDEIVDEDTDYQVRENRIREARKAAVQEILQQEGLAGVLRLAASGNSSVVMGRLVCELSADLDAQTQFVRFVLSDGDILSSPQHQNLLEGFFDQAESTRSIAIVSSLQSDSSFDHFIQMLTLAPFARDVWETVQQFAPEYARRYWETVSPRWKLPTEEDFAFVIQRLLDVHRPRAAFEFAKYKIKSVPLHQLYEMLEQLPLSKESQNILSSYDAHHIKEALAILNQSKAFSVDEMVHLELIYLDLFRHEKGGIPNIERKIAENPGFFVEILAHVYKRDDGSPEDVQQDESMQKLALKLYRLLDLLSQIPGQDKDPAEGEKYLAGWIDRVQTLCAENNRLQSCNFQIGKLLSRAPVDEQGIWPPAFIQDVLDRVLSVDAGGRIAEGIRIGFYNSRGVYSRGEGGQQEQELAEKYAAWADAHQYAYPRVSTVLRKMAEGYKNEAEWQDEEAAIRKRLRY